MSENMLKKEVDSLKLEGLTLVKNLKQSCAVIPQKPGVYVVLGNYDEMPDFLEKGTGPEFHFNKEKNEYIPMNYSIPKLVSKWVDDTWIMYIGKTDDTLNKRISTYIRFGKGKDVSHRGGRAIWQLPDSDNLVIGWKTIEGDMSAAQLETDWLKEFNKNHNGALPFANWKIG